MLLSVTINAWLVTLGSAFFMLLGVFILLLFYQFSKKRLIQQKQFERTLLQSQIEIQENTLNRISEEIHDNIGQLLSLARLNVNTLESNFPEQKINDIDELLERAIGDLRQLSHRLNAGHIKQTGLLQAIENLLKSLEKTGQFNTHLHKPKTELNVTEERSIILFRIVQEIVQNIIKHARATELEVRLEGNTNLERLIIQDNGKGFDTKTLSNTNGLGICNMMNRAAMINSKLEFLSTIGHGTTVTIYIQQ